MNRSNLKDHRNRNIIVVIAIVLSGILIGAFLYTQYFLKPEFNVFDAQLNPIKFNIQNIGKADAHNVKIKVNGSWTPAFRMNVTKVEHGYSVSPEQIATVFYGTICDYDENSGEWFQLAKRVVPSITGGETNGTTFVKLMVVENGTWRYLDDDEVANSVEAFGNPRTYYSFGETTIDILKVGEIETVTISLKEHSDSYQISISCDEGLTLQFSL